MTSARSPRRNPYRPGTASYARFRSAELRRRRALAEAAAARAKKPQARRRAKQRASAARRALQSIEKRGEYRSKLNDRDRAIFDRLPITQQDRLMTVMRRYPDTIPRDVPDPFVGPQRANLYRLSYATRAGIRLRPAG